MPTKEEIKKAKAEAAKVAAAEKKAAEEEQAKFGEGDILGDIIDLGDETKTILPLADGDGTSIDAGETEHKELKEVKKPTVPQFSPEDIKKYIESNPEEVKGLLGIKKEEALPVEDSTAKLVSVLTSLLQNQGQAPKRASNELQSILAAATKQSQMNLKKYQNVFQKEAKLGQTGELLIYKSYGKNLPTRSLKIDGPNGSKITKTLFEIGFLGVLLSFELGKTYSNVPNSIIRFINRKVAAYQDVVKGPEATKLTKAVFDIKKNAAA